MHQFSNYILGRISSESGSCRLTGRGRAICCRIALCALLSISASAYGDTIIDFEQFSDGEQITNQISGVQFLNTTVITAGISLNELEFPPHSGVNVAFDDGGPITIVFASAITDFKAYFDYSVQLAATAFNNANVVASAASLFSNNLAISGQPGSSPNELLELSSAQGFTKVTITGDPAGGSFVMDDVSFTSTATPEPAAGPFLALLFVALCLWRRW